MRRRHGDSGSMDMLLDTMCNTFGGVCFIALMVAIISASVPKGEEGDDGLQVSEERIATKEIAKLKRRRDMLKTAVELQSEFIKNATTGVVMKADLAKMVADVSNSEENLRLYEKKRVEYLDELAKLKTSASYSRREAARLARLLKELEDKVGRPLFDRHRVVRTPNEREVQGLSIVNVWLHERRLYLMDDRSCVSETETMDVSGRKVWECRLIKGHGVAVDDDFFRSGKEWRELMSKLGPFRYVRIFVDTVSFDELCLLRDALINRGSMYNWKVHESDVIQFVEGYDGRVQ